MPQTYYTLEATYRLKGVRASNRATLNIKEEEQELLDTLIVIARNSGHRGRLLNGLNADDFGYDGVLKRRKVSWNFRSSRQARAAEKQMKSLKRHYPRAWLKTKVTTFSDKDESMNEAKNYSITAGQYKSLIKGGHVRECANCNQCLPKYKGRYPSKCSCGGDVGMPIADAVESILKGSTISNTVETLLTKETNKPKSRPSSEEDVD